MKKGVLSTICLISCITGLCQNYKNLGDARVAQGDFQGAASFYELCMDSDPECALKFFKLIYEKKVEPYYPEQLYEVIMPLAQNGNGEAQFYLGKMYELGNGVEKNEKVADTWFRLSAETGFQEAVDLLKKREEEEMRRKAEEERLAAEQKAKEEEERLAAEQKAKEEERLAAEQKAKEEQERLVAEQKAKEEEEVGRRKVEGERVKETKTGIKFGGGVKAGLNMANISGADFSPDINFGFHVGALAILRLCYLNQKSPGFLALQPELLYSRQGFKIDDTSYSLDYLMLPILFKVYIANSFHLEAGPYFSYLAGVRPEFVTIDLSKGNLTDLKGGKDAGLCVGVGFDTSKGITFGARYMFGLSALANNLPWKNRVISVSVGWVF